MQYLVNNEPDNFEIVKIYFGFQNNVTDMLYKAHHAEYQIMKARALAKMRGASPVDVQISVGLLETDNLMQYERT